MGIPIGGKSMAEVRDQCERISRCRLSFELTKGNRGGLVNQQIVDSAMFDGDKAEQRSRLIEAVKLSESFFTQLSRHPVPVGSISIRLRSCSVRPVGRPPQAAALRAPGAR